MFKGDSQWILAVNMLYFDHFIPLCYSALPLPSCPPLFSSFQYLSLCPLPAQMWNISTLLAIVLSSFPSSPEFNSVVLPLNTCSACGWVDDSVCFCVYVYLLDLSSTYEKKHGFCLSESGLLHLTWWPPIPSIYFQTM
jgi:hypothetical protein